MGAAVVEERRRHGASFRGRAWAALLLAMLGPWLAGCAIRPGYAPPTVTVHSGTAPGRAPAAEDSLRVVCWNIQYGEDLDTALAELRGDPRLAAADVLLLQEMDPGGAAALADSLGLHHVYAAASVNPHHANLFGNAVLSRWPIAAHAAWRLPHATPVSGHRRLALAARIALGDGRELTAVSVHTATVVVAQEDRFEQFAAVLDSAAAAPGPVLVGGDFNTVSDLEGSRLRREARRRRFEPVRLPAGPTIRNSIKKLPGTVPVLDHLLVRGLDVGACGVARGTTASDHFPLWAVLALPRADDE